MNAEGITNDKLFLESCRWCKLPELGLVAEAGANLNECEKNGTNALVVAVAMGRNLEIIRYLVELGIDVNSGRKDNPWVKGIYIAEPDTSVLDVAERNCSEEVVSFLKEQGALHFTEIQN